MDGLLCFFLFCVRIIRNEVGDDLSGFFDDHILSLNQAVTIQQHARKQTAAP